MKSENAQTIKDVNYNVDYGGDLNEKPIRHCRMQDVDTLSISKVKYNVKIGSLFLPLAYGVDFQHRIRKSPILTLCRTDSTLYILSYALLKSFIFLILQKDNIMHTNFHQVHFVMVQFINS